jgi:predicted dehydrogenase
LDFEFFSSFECLKSYSISYIVIANETNLHASTLCQLQELGYRGIILVEKPLVNEQYEATNFDLEWIENIKVGYNLRFHPLIAKLKVDFVKFGRIIDISAYCGQYLPDWRPGANYQNSYSAKRDQGGGVLRDLSHELDYCQWISGRFKGITSIGGKFSSLNIDSDDIYNILAYTESMTLVNISINYLSRKPRRHILVNYESESVYLDLIENYYQIGNGEKVFVTLHRNDSYRLMHLDALSSSGNCCSYREGIDLVKAIEQCELKNAIKIGGSRQL